MARVDVDEIRRRAEMAQVVEHYLGAPQKTNSRGAWWRCPFHQERTGSLLVGGSARYVQVAHCFGCGWHGDVFEFVRAMENFNDDAQGFIAAARKLAGIVGAWPLLPERAPVKPLPVAQRPPSDVWQARARAFVAEAQRNLWKPQGAAVRRYLMQHRGFTEQTLRSWGLGYHMNTTFEDPGAWGLQREKRIWLPESLVMPGEVDGVLWYVKTRPTKNVKTDIKYYQLPAPDDAGRMALLGADRWQDGLPLLLTEGEMDLYTVWQEAREIVNVATLGGASKARHGLGRWLSRLLPFERIYLAYDIDRAGDEAREAFAEMSARFVPVGVPYADDVNAFHVAGGKVATWLRAEIAPAPVADCPPGYPVTLVFADAPGLALPAGQWKRRPDDAIECIFNHPQELQACIDVMKAVGEYPLLRGM